MTHHELRKQFIEFFADSKQGSHAVVPSSSLISDDPSVLLTTAGMQQFKPYFVGTADAEKDFGSAQTVSVQKCFRTSDVDEVGDETHLTFFEMLGNFSFGGYFKKEAITYAHEFITRELGLAIDYVSVFAGDDTVPKDVESERIWNDIGIADVRHFDRSENFWGPTGTEGPCGPTSEIYINGTEIWNLVFNEYYCHKDGSLQKLDTPGVDTGMGLERLAMVTQNTDTIFATDLFTPIVNRIPDTVSTTRKRIIADHARGIVFLISDGVRPSNTDEGYVLRRLIRRLIALEAVLEPVFDAVFAVYGETYPELDARAVTTVYKQEYEKFSQTLARGLRELEKHDTLDAASAFDLYQSFGLPFEVIKDKGGARAENINRAAFEYELEKHREVSRSGAGAFAGGLADDDPRTVRLHTAHHLLLAALQKVLGPHVKQRGSHITSKRLRMDFSHPKKLSDEERARVEKLVQDHIDAGLSVVSTQMSFEDAKRTGAEMEFDKKYPETVTVYSIQDEEGNVFSKELCGGPHVTNTKQIGQFRIMKEESSGAGVRRIRATVD